MSYELLTTTDALAKACDALKNEVFITVDTEFIREKTYYPNLCLVQVAGENSAFAIDPLAKEMDLDPLYALMFNPKILKVFHAAGQDLEIFLHEAGTVPGPLYDTQIAAMVCGYGEQVGYAKLVQDICDVELDKTSRYTDWAKRPLRDKQLDYAMADVTHLREIYRVLTERLAEEGRTGWVEEEMEGLSDPSLYRTLPEEAWKKIKPKSRGKGYFWKLRHVAQWRETIAQSRNVPRGRVLRDDMVAEIAHYDPATLEELEQLRGFGNHLRRDERTALLEALAEARSNAIPEDFETPKRKVLSTRQEAIMDMLKLCLKAQCGEHHVASKLVATRDELEALATQDEKTNVRARKGWRHDLFGQHAEALMRGEVSVRFDPSSHRLEFLKNDA